MKYLLKHLILLFLLPLPLLTLAQDGEFILKGQLTHSGQHAKVYLYREIKGLGHWDSTSLSNGTFSFRGQITKPELCTLTLLDGNNEKHDSRMIYLEDSTIEIVGDSSLKTAKILHSRLNADFIRFRAQLEPYSKLLDSINNSIANDHSASEKHTKQDTISWAEDIQRAYRRAGNLKLHLLRDYIMHNSDSYFSAGALTLLGQLTDFDLELLEPLYDSLTQRVKHTTAAKEFMASLEKKRHTNIGSTAPDFVQNDMYGHPVKLSDFRGKYVLLDFWASWCAPCREDNPNLLKVFNEFNKDNFTILSVSLDKGGKDRWLKAIEHDGIGGWTHVSDLKYWSNAAALLYSVRSVPANFLIDPSGKIIAKDLHANELANKLSDLFHQK